ncbi:hypothetical protein CERSUDRAFT_95228 [Gelatoporia subvermispora B]|uniref:Oxidase ustYa n=1 Tax=Ceriporiopsis subvermispora (strain B) TaxID=914234 RepID=M2QXV3_CERS8|nr:hypothetical protein CERSUDRAFT_95228 [Gelatoporia subvermispora B]
MRLPTERPAGSHRGSGTLLLASAMLLFSGLMQLATTWLQTRSHEPASCACSAAPSAQPESTSAHIQNWEADYTWEANDHPPYLPLDLGAPVALTLEDSRHYALDTPDAPAEYRSLYPGDGLGFVRLGPQRRFFGLAMYHQLHCLDSLRGAILGTHHMRSGGGEKEKRDVEHSAHCLNYLRQSILCAADVTLEPEVVRGSEDVEEGLGVTHVCRDWSRVYDFAERNWQEWVAWQDGQNGTRM